MAKRVSATDIEIPPELRVAERAIDHAIRQLPLWGTSREALIAAILHLYRDSIGVLHLMVAKDCGLAGLHGVTPPDPSTAVQVLAADPVALVAWLSEWARTRPVGSNPLPERETMLMGWKLVLRDEA